MLKVGLAATMLLPNVIRIRIGEAWKTDPELLRALRRAVGAAAQAEAAQQIVDVVSFEVDGIDIAAGQTEGLLLDAVESLVSAVSRLLAGEPRSAVHFQEGAIELLLRRRGSSAFLSLVKLTRPTRILAQDVEIDLMALAGAAQEAVRAFCRDLARAQPGRPAPYLERLLRSAGRLRGLEPLVEGPPVARRRRARRTRRRQDAPSCSFELHDDEGWIDSYRGGKPDLGSLLVPGRVTLRTAGVELFSLAGVPFLVLGDLVAAGARLAAAAQAGESRAEVTLARPGRTGTFQLVFDLVRNTVRCGAQTVGCSPLLVAQALLESAVDFCGVVTARCPLQARNAYLAELRASASEHLDHVRELLGGDLVTDTPAEVHAPRQRSLPHSPLGPGRTRHLAFQPLWQADVGTLSGLTRMSRLVVACGASATLGLDPLTGKARWRATGALWSAAAADHLLLAGSDRLASLDPLSGRERWSCDLPGATLARGIHPLSGGPAVLQLAASLVALDLASGRIAWRFEPPAASGLAAAPAGSLLVTAADNGLLYGIDPEGRLVWRLRAPGEIAARPALWKGLGLALFSNDRGGSLLAFDPASGKRAWEAPLDFTPTGPPVPFRGRLALAGLVAGDPVVTALEPDGRTAWTTGLSLGGGALSLAAFHTHLAAKAASGACVALDAAGRISWTQARACDHPPPGNLPPSAARGVLLVPSEQVLALEAASGQVLGTVPLTAPARWLVGADLSVTAADDQGLVTAVRLRTHLSLVTG